MTAYAIISDVHANLEALENVLKEIEKEKVDEVLFLGDAVGYGPNPNECIDLLKQNAGLMVAGNHDWAAVNMGGYGHFNPFARIAIEWTQKILSPGNRDFLRKLPLTAKIEEANIFLVHGTPREPGNWHYFLSKYDAAVNLEHFEEKICFVGHSHQPFIIESTERHGTNTFYPFTEVGINQRYIVNTGSVGQPRDANPDASYVILKDNRIEIKRVSYDIVVTQNKMKKAGLPEYLIERLAAGR